MGYQGKWVNKLDTISVPSNEKIATAVNINAALEHFSIWDAALLCKGSTR